jgi:Fe(3+) dicitrate transport protein
MSRFFVVLAGVMAVVLPVGLAAQTPSPVPGSSGALTGRVLDPSGAVLPNVTIAGRTSSGHIVTAVTDASGVYTLRRLPTGPLELTVTGTGFAEQTLMITVNPETDARRDVVLQIGGLAESIRVAPDRMLPGQDAERRIPGSFDVLDLARLETSRVTTTGELLRKAPGVHVRDEEGLGLRPNVGVRGLNPTRSSRVLMLEDGIPLTYAPYGDNAAYYHPPVERFDRVELLKGSGQIAYGPMTVGGVINYVTPAPPARSAGSFIGAAGNRGYLNAQGGWGTTRGRTGVQVDFMRKQGDGAREHISSDLHDVTAKVVSRLADRHVVTLRGSYFGEDSNITYSGLREDEYRADPRQNPFRNDFFYTDRFGASATHAYTISDGLVATTNLYSSNFRRHWWRQSSNSGQRPNDASDPACAGMANLSTTCGNEGRLRHYNVWGVEPRLRMVRRAGAFATETDIGVRAHFETQDRRQENGLTPTARSGVLVEDNERLNQAYSGFIQNRFIAGSWSVTPGIRVERVEYERTNRLVGASGRTHLTEAIPGIGAAFSPDARYTLFAGVHRGFTPPRTEDIINNTTGGSIDLSPERSWNYEAGARTNPRQGLFLEATFFRMAYENQVIPATLAGGVGSTLTNGGETLHQGLEVGARVDSAAFFASPHNVHVRAAYTWLPIAEFVGLRFSNVPGFGSTRITGNRLPYAPEHLLTAGAGITFASGLDLNAEAVLIADQFGDDLNSIDPSPDGQRGLLPGFMLWNAAGNYPVRSVTIFATVKNLFDRTEIVDRSRGILPTAPRTVITGVKVRF